MDRGRYSAKLSLCTSNNALPCNGGTPYSLTRKPLGLSATGGLHTEVFYCLAPDGSSLKKITPGIAASRTHQRIY